MAYLKFNKEELVNLEYSLDREILLTDRTGGYLNTTIVGCNTRKYHGLLTVPVRKFGGEKYILLSTLHESLIQHGQSFNLGINSYGDVYEPRGHKYIVDFEMDSAPRMLYRVGGTVFSKSFVFLPEGDELLVKYQLHEAQAPTILRIKPFLAFRNIHALTHANTGANTRYKSAENGVAFRMYGGFPTLFLQLNKKNEWVASPDWYRNVSYKEESRRGFEDREDLFVPGYFELPIRPGESVVLSAGLTEVNTRTIKHRCEQEMERTRDTRNSFGGCLRLAAGQFLIQPEPPGLSVCEGYAWEYEDLRSSLAGAAGLTLYNNGDAAAFEQILDTIVRKRPEQLYASSDAPDVPLWFFRALQQYIAYGADASAVWRKYGKVLLRILDSYRSGVRDEIRLHENGLLWSEKKGRALSWMNTYVNGIPVNERSGYQVETNALWYNAIRFFQEADSRYGDGMRGEEWEPVAERIRNNYLPVFWSEERQHLADFVNENGRNLDTRPNQLLACAVEYAPFSEETGMLVLRSVEKELITTRGIRTLSPKNPRYKGRYEGDQAARDLAHHNGCAYPWLLGAYIDAALRMKGRSFVPAGRKLLEAFEEDIAIHGVGSVAELYDGDPAHRPHGCISSSASVAEILRGRSLLNEIEK